MARWKMAVAVIIVGLIAFGLIFPRFFLIPAVEQSLTSYLKNEFAAQDAKVNLDVSLGWELIVGRIPAVTIELDEGTIGGLPVSAVGLKGQEIRFDPWILISEGRFVYWGADSLQIEARVSEGGLNEYFWREVDPSQRMALTVKENSLRLSGSVTMWGISWDINLDGTLEIHGASSLRFIPLSLQVEEAVVPPALLDFLSAHFGMVIDFGTLPFPIEIREILIEDGFVTVNADAAGEE